ncbi:MAG: DUF3391 domain-containing protein [Gammaproteobacteria bacterium]|nr:DUF3391 domain-containing protein [Gammaproteobacteria bacterium]NIR83450.1 DUF3391 domain-containing protein [Gammaproteobacteria bacterium]NIR91372.1 DUF3391 domain-containing protein [Gammaproteobacteria bacterium]NIU04612.1 DUF3391 domain-containing protein [Gammaproteobacteria bacterium]NIV51654.1 DUF3391 domain-containing protein [Gammaproteobacteria bacterium]
MEKKVDARNLTFGMYVSRLDRPWLQTPFESVEPAHPCSFTKCL